jgi:hypothetical protein
MPEEKIVPIRTRQILGIKLFDASAGEAVAYAARHGGLLGNRRAFPHCPANTTRNIGARWSAQIWRSRTPVGWWFSGDCFAANG